MAYLDKINEIFNSYGIYMMAVLLLLLIILLVYIIKVNKRVEKLQKSYNVFMSGKNAKSLEETLQKIVEDNKKVKQQCKNDIDAIIDMKKGLKATYKKIGIMKYDTFRGMSGKLSFSLALLDGENSGFVLSCMHTQDGCYSYLKEIIHGESHVTLSNEESDALKSALEYNTDNIKIETEKID